MKVLSAVFAVVALFFLALLAINMHDFLFDETLPWRESDFRSVMTRCAAGFVAFALSAFVARRISNKDGFTTSNPGRGNY